MRKRNIKKIVRDCETLVPDIAKDESGIAKGNDHIILKHLYFGTKEPTIFPLLEEPIPPEPWIEILDGTGEGPKPVQAEFGSKRIAGAEDCLFVNVFTKEVNPSVPKPVMVWIHGGGFVGGSTSRDLYSPDYFLSRDVVLVSVAYRLGLFGFLSMKDPSLKVPGNAGLKDQILGLKWVQQNISKFGGDPNNVTIFGESAGGASVHLLALTEKTKGLFHRVICMSGSAFAFWATPPVRNWSFRIAKDLGFKGEDNELEILNFLRSVDSRKLAAAEDRVVSKEESYAGYVWCSYPVVEPYVTDQCVIPREPILMAHDSWSNSIPMIIGCTSREGIFFRNLTPPGIYEQWESDPTLMLPFDLKSDPNSERSKELGECLKKESFGTEKITDDNYINFISNKLFWHPAQRTVLSRQKYATAPTYLYVFDFDSPNYGLIKTLSSINLPGVSHGDDLGYLFLNMALPETQPDSPERKVIQKFIALWTQFARNGDPNCEEIAPVKWEPVESNETPHRTLIINLEPSFKENPFAKILKFWDGLYDENKLA